MATPVVAGATLAAIGAKRTLTGAQQMALATGQLDPSSLGDPSQYVSYDERRIRDAMATQFVPLNRQPAPTQLPTSPQGSSVRADEAAASAATRTAPPVEPATVTLANREAAATAVAPPRSPERRAGAEINAAQRAPSGQPAGPGVLPSTREVQALDAAIAQVRSRTFTGSVAALRTRINALPVPAEKTRLLRALNSVAGAMEGSGQSDAPASSRARDVAVDEKQATPPASTFPGTQLTYDEFFKLSDWRNRGDQTTLPTGITTQDLSDFMRILSQNPGLDTPDTTTPGPQPLPEAEPPGPPPPAPPGPQPLPEAEPPGPLPTDVNARILAAWNTARGETGYEEELDLNQDGVINALDQALAVRQGAAAPATSFPGTTLTYEKFFVLSDWVNNGRTGPLPAGTTEQELADFYRLAKITPESEQSPTDTEPLPIEPPPGSPPGFEQWLAQQGELGAGLSPAQLHALRNAFALGGANRANGMIPYLEQLAPSRTSGDAPVPGPQPLPEQEPPGPPGPPPPASEGTPAPGVAGPGEGGIIGTAPPGNAGVVPPSLMDRLFGIFDKINAGGALTDEEFGLLPADARRQYLEAAASGDLAGANTATAATMEELFGIFDKANRGELLTFDEIAKLPEEGRVAYLQQLYGTPDERLVNATRSALQNVIEQSGLDVEAEKRTRISALDRRYDEARTRLARQFGIDPGGERTGRAQRSFEQLELQRLQELDALDVEMGRLVEDVRVRNTELLTNTLTQIGGLDLAGKEFGQKVSEFGKVMELELKKFGLTEQQVQATIAQINAEISNSTLRNTAEITKIQADIGQSWAQILGFAGTESGALSAETLGVSLGGLPAGMPGMLSLTTPEASAVRASFSAMMGRAPTENEVARILEGRDVQVQGMPTLEARQLAATVTEQHLERTAKYAAISAELGFETTKFQHVVELDDRQWSLTTLDVAPQFGLDPENFRTAKYWVDSQINNLFFETDLTPQERVQREFAIVNEAANNWFAGKQGQFLQANDLFNRLYGDQQRQLAAANGMEAEKYEIGARQAQSQEDRMLETWASILAGDDVITREPVSDVQARSAGYADFRINTLNLLSDVPIPDYSSSSDYTNKWLEAASAEQIEEVREGFENTFGGLFPDPQLRFSLTNYVQSVFDGSNTFHYEYLRNDWFQGIDSEKVSAITALLGSPITPERSSSGGAWWEQLLQVGGSIAASYVTGGIR